MSWVGWCSEPPAAKALDRDDEERTAQEVIFWAEGEMHVEFDDDVQVRRSNAYHGLLKRIMEGHEVNQSELAAAGAALGLSAEQVQMAKAGALRAHYPEHQPE